MRQILRNWYLVGCLLWVGAVHAEWLENGQPAPETSWRKAWGPYGAMLFLTDKPDELFQAWEKPGEGVPASAAGVVTRGGTIAGVVFFTGCTTGKTGLCDANVVLQVFKPDGTAYSSKQEGELWVDKPPPPEGALQLAVGAIVVRIEPKDPTGTYTIRAKLHDRISRAEVELSRQFEVGTRPRTPESQSETPEPEIISSPEALNLFIQGYYLQPKPEMVGSAIKFLNASDLLRDRDSRGAMVGFFAEVFAWNPGRRRLDWREITDRCTNGTKSMLKRAWSLSSDTERLLKGTPSEELNDMWWGAFFATGDRAYLDRLIAQLEYMGERRNRDRFLTAATAKWSLASNASNHDGVRAAVEEARGGASPALRKELDDVLNKTPKMIHEETVEVVREQMERGAW